MDHETTFDSPSQRDPWRPLRLELHPDQSLRLPTRPPRQDQGCQMLPVWQVSSDRASNVEPDRAP